MRLVRSQCEGVSAVKMAVFCALNKNVLVRLKWERVTEFCHNDKVLFWSKLQCVIGVGRQSRTSCKAGAFLMTSHK